MVNDPELIRNDPWLKPFGSVIIKRLAKVGKKELNILHGGQKLQDFATGHLYFWLHKISEGWVLREWAPNAVAIFLVGEFSGWKETKEYAFTPLDNGCWELKLEQVQLHHKVLYKLSIHWKGGQAERIPAFARRVVQDEITKIYSAQVWDPPIPYTWKKEVRKNNSQPLLIYE